MAPLVDEPVCPLDCSVHSGLSKRDAGVNLCAVLMLRFDREFPINELQAFLHTGEAEPRPFHNHGGIKANPPIAHSQLNLVRFSTERYFEMSCTAMLGRILQGFLQDAVEAKGDFLWQFGRDARTLKIDLHFLPVRKLFAKTGGSRRESQVFQLRRVQPVRQGVNIVANSP